MSDRRDGVPTTVTSIPLVDPHAPKADPSIGDLVKDATAQVSTLVRAEVELAKAEITRDVVPKRAQQHPNHEADVEVKKRTQQRRCVPGFPE